MVRRKIITPLAMFVAAATLMLGAGQANAGDFSIGFSIGGHGHHGNYRYNSGGHHGYGYGYNRGYSGHRYGHRNSHRGHGNYGYRGHQRDHYYGHRRIDHYPRYRRGYRGSCGY